MKIGGFTVQNKENPVKGHVIEDAFVAKRIQEKICLVVADGITRDPLPVLPDKNTPEGKSAWRKHYPDPSPAYEVARRTCNAFPQSLRSLIDVHVWDAIDKASESALAYNRRHFSHPDYLTHDEAGCQFAYAIIDGKRMWYGSLSSCGVTVVDVEGNVRMKTPDTYWPHDAERHTFLQHAGLKNFASGHGIWSEPETRYILRSTFRNKKISGGYGILTGNPKALDFLQMGEYTLNEREQVLVYSDGTAELLFEHPLKERTRLRDEVKKFVVDRDFRGLESYCKKNVRSEGTLAYVVGR